MRLILLTAMMAAASAAPAAQNPSAACIQRTMKMLELSRRRTRRTCACVLWASTRRRQDADRAEAIEEKYPTARFEFATRRLADTLECPYPHGRP